MSPKVLITTSSFDTEHNFAIANLRRNGYEIVVNPFGRRLTETEAEELVGKHRPVGMIAGVESLSARVLEAAQGLRALARCGTGIDNVDLATASRLEIKVSNTPDAPTQPVAELTLGLILSVVRHIVLADRSLRSGIWTQPRGQLLCGKTVGLIGFGRIGRRVEQLLRPFEVRVVVCDPAYQGDVPGVVASSLRKLLEAADVVSLHVSVSSGTRHLLGEEEIGLLKPSAVLINTARGGLIDEVALCSALEAGRLGGAGIDVYEEEPYSGPLRLLDNVVLTCHMGTSALEARALMEAEASANLVRDLGLTFA